MTVLALDTTSECGSLAIQVDGKLAAEVALQSQNGFAHLIFPAIDRVLDQAGLRLPAIDCFAAASGPGAFTGVRVGLSAVKGLAEAMRKPALGVSNLRALASFGKSSRRAVVLDARRGEIFGAVYDSRLEPVEPEVVRKLESWLDSLQAPEYEFVATSGSCFRAALANTRFGIMTLIETSNSLAPAIAYCANLDGRRGLWCDPAALDANYVRRSDAELLWKDA